MKKKNVPVMRKVRVIANGDIYHTVSDWETKEVDGVKFIYVIKQVGVRETPKLIRKDSVEFVK